MKRFVFVLILGITSILLGIAGGQDEEPQEGDFDSVNCVTNESPPQTHLEEVKETFTFTSGCRFAIQKSHFPHKKILLF